MKTYSHFSPEIMFGMRLDIQRRALMQDDHQETIYNHSSDQTQYVAICCKLALGRRAPAVELDGCCTTHRALFTQK